MSDYNFSIIIPHKNTPDLLQRCLDSVPRREDIQIIVVDDNSDSSVVDFDRFPGREEENIEVYFTNEGKGAGYARNIGLEHVKGQWVLFVDADDYFTDNALSCFDQHINSENDIIFFATTSIYPDTGEEAIRHLFDKECLQEALLNNNDQWLRYKRTSPVSKMIRKELLSHHNIRFEEVFAANDAMFSIQSGYYAKSIGVDDRVLYVITVRKGSLEYTFSNEILITRINVDYRINHFFKSHKIDERVRILRYILPLRHVSKSILISQLLRYLSKDVRGFISDILFFATLYIKTRIKNTNNQRKNKSYVEIK
ncbi:MAG: glycosyltransferase family 2 protein [Bacteroidales bacterium]